VLTSANKCCYSCAPKSSVMETDLQLLVDCLLDY
jgi:hypothetical protein